VEVERTAAAANAIETGINELQRTINRQEFEIAYRRAERDRVQVLVSVAEQRLAEHRNQLNDEDKERYDLEQQLAASRGELARLSQTSSVVGKPPPTVLQHLPTPMARTVFGTEVHFRLQGGRIAYVPWEEMIEMLKADAKNHVNKLRDAPRVELSLPVICGFGARYILRRVEVATNRPGAAPQGSIELERLYFVDAEPNLGQPVGQAIQPTSELMSRLSAFRPQSATVTIWVYPDSFDDFRTIKSELFKLGYLTAGRPLPDGHPIGGAPDGSRSSAE
jgi:hypothetical protein